MKKTRAYALLLAGLMLVSLAGCGTAQTPSAAKDNPPFADTPADVPSATEISDDIPAEESAPPAAEPEQPAITGQISSQTAEEKTRETPPKENSAAPPSAQSEQPRETQPPRQTETPKPEEPKAEPPQPQIPVTEKPESSAESITLPPAKPTESEPAFDINYWISFAKSYAISIGLELDSSAVDCWDNPIIAGVNSKYLERDLCGMLNKYSRDEDITAVWIWAEPRKANSWDIYIGYA